VKNLLFSNANSFGQQERHVDDSQLHLLNVGEEEPAKSKPEPEIRLAGTRLVENEKEEI